MFYQWRRDGVPFIEGGDISGSDGSTVLIANAELGDAGNYDVIVSNGYSTGVYAGSLQVNNLAGTLTVGQSYQIFGAGGSGSFSSITPAPGGGMAWSFNAASGVLSIVSTVNTTPTNMMYGVSNDTVYLTWPEDHTGWQLQMQTNSLSTNWFPYPGSIGTNELAIPLDPAHTNAFYRLIYPPQP